MTIKYVKDFEFPAKAGYTKSAARKPAKMARGGRATDAELRLSTDAELRALKRAMDASGPVSAAQKAMGASGRATYERLSSDAELRALKRAMDASGPVSDAELRAAQKAMGARMGSSLTLEEIEAMAIADALRDQEEQDYLQELIVEELIGDRVEGAARLTDAEIRALERLTDAELRALDDNERVDFNDGGSALQNVRDEEGRVINIQDDAADELHRVEERTPYDAQEREDKSAQLARIGAREKDAHEELHRDRDEAVMLEAQEGGSKKDWIKNAIKKPGALRNYTDTASGKSIPKGELNKLAAGKPGTKGGPKPSAKTVKRAGLAKTLGKMNTKKAATGGSMKKQGYDDRLDESLGMSNGKNSQSMKARRNESKGMEKAMGKRAYSRVGTMDKAKGGSTSQGYNDKLDESLGSRNGKKSQSMKSRRDESKGMEKSMGKRAYSAVDTMDMAKGGSTNKLAAVNRSTALKGFKQMGVMKRG